MPTFADRQTAMLERQRTEFGEDAVFTKVTFGTPDYKAGSPPTETVDGGPTTVKIVRSKTFEDREVDRFAAWLLAADLAWTPDPAHTRVVFGGVTYKPAAVEPENDGLAYRCRFERLGSE